VGLPTRDWVQRLVRKGSEFNGRSTRRTSSGAGETVVRNPAITGPPRGRLVYF